MERTTTLYYHPDIIYRMTSLYRKERKIQDSMNKNFEFMLNKKIESMAENNDENIFVNCEKNKKFIDFLLDEKNVFSAEEKRDHVKATTFAVSLIKPFQLKLKSLLFPGI